MLPVRDRNGAATFTVRVQPGRGRNQLVGVRDGELVVQVAPPAVDGRANEALCRYLAEVVGVRATRVRIVLGDNARRKVVAVEGMTAAELASKLQADG